jgi:hypothetical protein
MGIIALERSFGFDVNVLRDSPGPHRMKACRPDVGAVACGISASVHWNPMGGRRFHDNLSFLSLPEIDR